MKRDLQEGNFTNACDQMCFSSNVQHNPDLYLGLFLFKQEYQQIVDAEWDILYDKLDKIVQSGAKVVLSKLPIGDVATQYFADR